MGGAGTAGGLSLLLMSFVASTVRLAAPLMLAARGVISRTAAAPYEGGGASGRRVPTVTACRPELATGGEVADGSWLAAIDGATGEVALLAR